jgi:hypothetical protein
VTTAFQELSAYRGLSPRQARLLDLRAWLEGTQYDHRKYTWDQAVVAGRYVPTGKRIPSVQSGKAREKADKLVDKLTGDGRLPTLRVSDGGDEETPRAVALRDLLWSGAGLDLAQNLDMPALDLIGVGAGCLGFHRTSKAPETWEPVYLEPEWCEVVYASQAGGARALQIAEDLVAAGALPEGSGRLPIPEGARSDEVVFLRYMYPFASEVATSAGGAQTKTSKRWRRRDYLPDAIVEYEDVEVQSSTQAPVDWVAKPLEPHKWGVVPLVWMTPRGTRAGATDGPSLLSGPVQSIIEAIDRTMSLKDSSVALNCSPPLVTIDVADRRTRLLIEQDLAGQNDPSPADAGAVYNFESIGEHPSVMLLEVSGTAAKSAEEHLADLDAMLDRATGVVEYDQSEAGGALSGVALERMLEPTIARVNAYRSRIGPQLVRLAQKLAKALGWADLDVSVQWPAVVGRTAADVLASAQAFTAATGAPVMSTETGARLFAGDAGLDDPEVEARRVVEELEATTEQLPAFGGSDDDDDEG